MKQEAVLGKKWEIGKVTTAASTMVSVGVAQVVWKSLDPHRSARK
jgi:hypothetical protein